MLLAQERENLNEIEMKRELVCSFKRERDSIWGGFENEIERAYVFDWNFVARFGADNERRLFIGSTFKPHELFRI